MRPDLAFSARSGGRGTAWVVKDPVTLRYSHLGDHEYFILRQLDGTSSLQEIKRRFDRRFAPLSLPIERLQDFIGSLHASGLVLSETAGQGSQLQQRGDRSHRRSVIGQWTNLLAIRFRGIDPERILNWMYPLCRVFFTPAAMAFAMSLVVAALLVVFVRFETLLAKLPAAGAFFAADNLVLMFAALAVLKVIHEFGHGLTCKHFGGECHEIGFMFLVFTPCLYCNVSDAWMMPNKWHRIAVSAAGIIVEVILAAACTLIWAYSEPGLLNSLALNVMVIASVGTIFFNGNPLLRYDGYYIASDLFDVPNLARQSRSLLRGWLMKLTLGVDLPADRMLLVRRRGWLAAYGVASLAYRWALVLTILYLVYMILKPRGMEVFAVMLAAIVLSGMVLLPLASVVSAAKNPFWRRQIHRTRAAVAMVLVTGLVIVTLTVPLPFRVRADAVVEPDGAKHVYVTVPGRLLEAVAAGDEVKTGQPLASLENYELDLQIAAIEGQKNRQQKLLEGLEVRRSFDPTSAAQIPAAREALTDLQERLDARRRDREDLTLVAPLSGIVIPPPNELANTEPGDLPTWGDTPLAKRNHGCFLEAGTLFCSIGDPSRVEAILSVEQSDVKFVRKGQQVEIQLHELAGRTVNGEIVEIAEKDLQLDQRVRRPGQRLGMLGQTPDEPLETMYQARVRLELTDEQFLIGARGHAKIHAEPQSLGQRLARYLARTFHFDL